METLYLLSILIKMIKATLILFICWASIKLEIESYKETKEMAWFVYIPAVIIIIVLGL